MGLENAYMLVMNSGRDAAPRIIEFEARGAESALLAAERHCAGRRAEVFENGQSLGMVQSGGEGGFWVITPAA